MRKLLFEVGPSNFFLYNSMESDYKARVELNSLLMGLPFDLQRVFLLKLLQESLKPEYDNTTATVFPNTLEHREKLRTWQSIMILLPCLVSPDLDSSEAVDALNLAWENIDQENMPSTRYFMEFFIIRVLLAHPVLLPTLWDRLKNWDATPSACISSLVISFHVGKLLAETPAAEAFSSYFFDLVLPFLLHNNYTVRIYATKIYHSTYDLFKSFVPVKGYQNLYHFINTSANCERFLQKLKDDHFLSNFSPLSDFNLHFIFCELPSRAEIANDELIPGVAFPQESPIPISQDYISAKGEGEIRPLKKPLSEEGQIYQQKIVPFELARYDLELSEFNALKSKEARKERDGQIILVASLVEKTPNLAGLCRTCEIMGATSLVLPSLAISETVDFKNISMTSDRWLELESCKATDLADYLIKKRIEGFRLVAVEQTSASYSLEKYNFPRDLVLVLGGESHGIPAHILQIVDDCVEIPQFGLTRSLNVHVSGSLVLWELRRQRILTASSSELKGR
jgi:tRNA guanosine-2'-O-methyltransferase